MLPQQQLIAPILQIKKKKKMSGNYISQQTRKSMCVFSLVIQDLWTVAGKERVGGGGGWVIRPSV